MIRVLLQRKLRKVAGFSRSALSLKILADKGCENSVGIAGGYTNCWKVMTLNGRNIKLFDQNPLKLSSKILKKSNSERDPGTRDVL